MIHFDFIMKSQREEPCFLCQSKFCPHFCIWQYFRTLQQPNSYLYADTSALSPLLLTYACPHCLMKTWRPCGVRCASVDEGETEGPTFISCVSPGFWGYLLLTQEWKPQIKVFVLTKDKRDFSFTQTVQDCVGLLKVSGKNVSWSAPLMKHVHEISACMPLLMFSLYTYKEVARIGGKEKWYFRKREGCRPSLLCIHMSFLSLK